MKRKSTKEIRLEERMRGYSDCLEEFMEAWRKTVKVGPNGAIDVPIMLWPIIEVADKKMSKLDLQYKKVMWPRVYGVKFDL